MHEARTQRMHLTRKCRRMRIQRRDGPHRSSDQQDEHAAVQKVERARSLNLPQAPDGANVEHQVQQVNVAQLAGHHLHTADVAVAVWRLSLSATPQEMSSRPVKRQEKLAC